MRNTIGVIENTFQSVLDQQTWLREKFINKFQSIRRIHLIEGCVRCMKINMALMVANIHNVTITKTTKVKFLQ